MNHEDQNDCPEDQIDLIADEPRQESRRARGRGPNPPESPRADTAPGAAERFSVGDRVTIYRNQDESPYWQIQYNLDGRQIRRSLKTARKDSAIKIARKKDGELVLGQAEHPDAKPITIAHAREQYLATVRLRGRSAQTLTGYESKLAVFEDFCEARHVRHLNRVTAAVLEAYQSALASRGVAAWASRKSRRGPGFKSGANKARTVRDKMKIVRQMIKWACKRRLLKADPAAGYDLPPAVKTKAHCWSPQELKAVLDNAPDGFADLFDFLRMTGLRSDELCWLTKSDFCADPPHLNIRAKTCGLSGKSWRPKHGSERIVPLCPEAMAIAKKSAAASPGPWLFHAPDTHGDQPGLWRKQRIWLAVKAAMKAGGVASGTTHTFRHVFCSFLARQNVPPFTLMKIMGHDSLEIVLQYYHVSQRELLDGIARVPFGAMLESEKISPDEGSRGGENKAEN